MAKQSENLFEESSQGGVSAVTAVVFVLSFILAMGGLVLMSYGFNTDLTPTTEMLIFSGGLIASFIGFALPFAILPPTGK
ncbi:hypothetical protein [Leucobacter denitrificans]|uniref:Uncharacterized protein n=1 Tax=Leucobacter denitrificans TaxID=683042 RepID=A0A7G9S4N1_9MICO|nr:hypothetical protein [Leucobacter denitrificans]QNN62806.1 hypothetical protein H9L06_11465 [Leucobacter denitrificans]